MKSIGDAIFHLIKFQAKVLQLYWKETPAYLLSYTYFVERRKTASSEISFESQNSSTG